MVSACPQYFYVGFIIPKWSPLQPALDFGVQNLRESGILERIYAYGGDKVSIQAEIVEDRRRSAFTYRL